MHIAINCCRKDARFYHTNQFNLSENGDGPWDSEMVGNMEDIQNEAGRISPTAAKASYWLGLIGGAANVIFLAWFIVKFTLEETGVIKYPPTPVIEIRNQPNMSMEELTDNFSTFVKYASLLETLCAPIQLDDLTYKTMKINFDDAVLHETLKFKGHSRNIREYKENHLIL